MKHRRKSSFKGGYYGRTLFSQDTLEGIFYEYSKMKEDPFHSEALKKKQMDFLFQESNINSARLEVDLMLNPHNKPHSGRISRKKIDEETRKISRNVRNAFLLASNHYKGKLTEDLIVDLGHSIDPDSNKDKILRNVSAPIGNCSAISHDKLRSYDGFQGHLDRFLEEVNGNFMYFNRKSDDKLDISCFEKAVHSHFMSFYLQPNFDGNKRTGRILQNTILKSIGCPPPIVHSPENNEYTHKMVNAFKARRHRDGNPISNAILSQDEHKFYDYMGKRILISLEKLNDVLDSKKTFYVSIDKTSKSTNQSYNSANNALTSLMKKRDENGQVRYKKVEDYLLVRGNLTGPEVEAVMDSIKGIKKYSVFPNPPHR